MEWRSRFVDKLNGITRLLPNQIQLAVYYEMRYIPHYFLELARWLSALDMIRSRQPY